MPVEDFAKASEHVMIVPAQRENTREGIFGRKFQTDKLERIARAFEAYARRQ
jgi:hypothetical protein